ncbi:hypothetical protein K0M31_004734 [Melipona bicolor]|uniref:Uncharacterized protein n=1 Tax=Melipona bicolor TaxID=60889 RepID=A0AA40FVE5_9HYME|nr:hypothetical protein K0M31_004734 [Melipona bicolor]
MARLLIPISSDAILDSPPPALPLDTVTKNIQKFESPKNYAEIGRPPWGPHLEATNAIRVCSGATSVEATKNIKKFKSPKFHAKIGRPPWRPHLEATTLPRVVSMQASVVRLRT